MIDKIQCRIMGIPKPKPITERIQVTGPNSTRHANSNNQERRQSHCQKHNQPAEDVQSVRII